MSTSPTSKAPLRPSKFIEGPPLTSTTPNLAQSDEQLQIVLLEMDSYESSRQSQCKSKSRSSSSSSSNSNSSHSSTSSLSSLSSIPFFTSSASKRMSRDYSPPLSPTSASNKRCGGVRASLDMGNPFTAFSSSDHTPGRSRGSTVGSMNASGILDEGSMTDAPFLGLKIKGRLRAWSRAQDDGVRSHAVT